MAALSLQAPPFSNDQLEHASHRLLLRLRDAVGEDHLCRFGVRFDDMYQAVARPLLGISLEEDHDLGFDESGEKILGSYLPGVRIARIDAILSTVRKDPRRGFTLWHEVVGHGMLQTIALERQLKGVKAAGPIVVTAVSLSPTEERRLEWQANRFAGLAAVPSCFRDAVIRRVLRTPPALRYGGPAEYYFEVNSRTVRRDVSSFEDFCLHLAGFCREYFADLSVTALARRIAESRLVQNECEAFLLGKRRPGRTTSPSDPNRLELRRRSRSTFSPMAWTLSDARVG